MTVPYWVKDAIFYQIFPDRFANGDFQNDPPNVQPWGSPPTFWGFQGGDLRGIIEKIDYLLDLGVNALYLTPIFLSPSPHRYNAIDYYQVDPLLGEKQDFDALLKVAHSNQMRVILDGVFNHCSRGFFAFVDLLENQDHSPYTSWFNVNRFPLDAYSPGKAENYRGWWDHKSMPKFNTKNPQVRRYLLNVARYWIEQGIDGWRLDVPNEIDDDSFWEEFRYVVKTVNRDAYLVGEIWTADPRWVGPKHFDGLMNYPLRDAWLDFFNGGPLTASGLVEKAEGLLKLYPRENTYAMYTLLGSHDTERIWTKLNGVLDKVKLAYTFLMAWPGAPAIYYGDEIGLKGGGDPECRGAFPWDQESWLEELRSWVQSLVSARKSMVVMRRGEYKRLLVDDRRRCIVFARILGDERVLVALNASPTHRSLHIPVSDLGWRDGRILHSIFSPEEYYVAGDSVSIHLPAWGGIWIK